MSALRMEKQLGRILDFSYTKSTLASRGSTFDISRMVTGLVTVKGNSRTAKSRERAKTGFD